MKPQFTLISIRFKIMIALLFVVTAVVSIITYTMANMFHADKQRYLSDVTALAASHAAENADIVVDGYQNRLLTCGRIYEAPDLAPAARQHLLRVMVADFPALISLSVWRDGREVASLHDGAALAAGGLTREDFAALLAAHPVPLDSLTEGRPRLESFAVSARLPALRMATSMRTAPGQPPLALVAVLRRDDLQQLTGTMKAFSLALFDDQRRLVAQGGMDRAVIHDLSRELPELEGRVLAQARALRLGGVELIGSFAPSATGRLTAVALVPRSAAYFASRELLGHLIVVALLLLGAAALAGLLWSTTLTRSLSRLMEAARAVGQGRFSVQVDVRSRDEIGTLAGSFNSMASELHARETALKQAQAQLIQSEKLAAFGQLGAGIAHEVKNPLAGIQGVVQLSLRQCEAGTPLQQALQMIEKETKRCRVIIDNLLKFARQEKVIHVPTSIDAVIADAAAIMRHQLELKNVKLETAVDAGLPTVSGSANQLQQVLMNLILNGQQAMAGQPGRVAVAARLAAPDRLEIRVQDDGPGIPKEIQHRIFEPFYSTKPTGQGTGLGLSVSFGIVKDHGGQIAVESEPGAGTCFVITLPVPPQPPAPAVASETPAQQAAPSAAPQPEVVA